MYFVTSTNVDCHDFGELLWIKSVGFVTAQVLNSGLLA